jgi:hypothetical protein
MKELFLSGNALPGHAANNVSDGGARNVIAKCDALQRQTRQAELANCAHIACLELCGSDVLPKYRSADVSIIPVGSGYFRCHPANVSGLVIPVIVFPIKQHVSIGPFADIPQERGKVFLPLSTDPDAFSAAVAALIGAANPHVSPSHIFRSPRHAV